MALQMYKYPKILRRISISFEYDLQHEELRQVLNLAYLNLLGKQKVFIPRFLLLVILILLVWAGIKALVLF